MLCNIFSYKTKKYYIIRTPPTYFDCSFIAYEGIIFDEGKHIILCSLYSSEISIPFMYACTFHRVAMETPSIKFIKYVVPVYLFSKYSGKESPFYNSVKISKHSSKLDLRKEV